MNISEALKEKGLKLVGGERRLKSELSASGHAQIYAPLLGQYWEIKVDDGQVTITDAHQADRPHLAKFVSPSEVLGLNPRNIRLNPSSVRTTADDTPSL